MPITLIYYCFSPGKVVLAPPKYAFDIGVGGTGAPELGQLVSKREKCIIPNDNHDTLTIMHVLR